MQHTEHSPSRQTRNAARISLSDPAFGISGAVLRATAEGVSAPRRIADPVCCSS